MAELPSAPRRRVVITGLGAVSPVGIGADVFASAVRAGADGTAPIRSFDASGFPRRRAGEVNDFEPTDHLKRLDPAAWGRSGLLAAAAARLAVADAGIGGGAAGAGPGRSDHGHHQR